MQDQIWRVKHDKGEPLGINIPEEFVVQQLKLGTFAIDTELYKKQRANVTYVVRGSKDTHQQTLQTWRGKVVLPKESAHAARRAKSNQRNH